MPAEEEYMKTHILFALISFSLIISLLTSCKKEDNQRKNEVIVYTYDSFAGEWGPGPELIKRFEETTGKKLTLIDCGDGVQVLNRAILEKNDVQADVIIGIDNNSASKILAEDILLPYKPKDADNVIEKDIAAALCSDWSITPYDYSHFAIIYNTQSDVQAPLCLEDLTKEIYKKKIILMDPRTSTPGLGFVAWTVAVFGDKVLDYWRALKPNILTLAPGWSAGYGLFTEGEAPLVISYTTSPAYHVEYENTNVFKALIFEQGHSNQVEGAAILKNAPNTEGAKQFLDFFISSYGQDTLPLTQWMYPVNKTVDLPESYKIAAPIPQKTLSADVKTTEKAVTDIINLLSE